MGYNASFAHLMGKIATVIVKAFAMENGSDNELDEPQNCTIK
jgi:hypothetical protein